MKEEHGKIPIKLIHIPDWATSALVWGIWKKAKNDDRFRIVRITDDPNCLGSKDYGYAHDGLYPAVLYFCESCGMPLETLFCDCKCGVKYERAVEDEMTIILQTLDCNLPRAIVIAHNSEVFGDVRGRPRYEWTAPEDEKRQPSFHLPKLR
jgi:hypothetical protein